MNREKILDQERQKALSRLQRLKPRLKLAANEAVIFTLDVITIGSESATTFTRRNGKFLQRQLTRDELWEIARPRYTGWAKELVKHYIVTSNQTLTLAEISKVVSTSSGTRIQFTDAHISRLNRRLKKAGLPIRFTYPKGRWFNGSYRFYRLAK